MPWWIDPGFSSECWIRDGLAKVGNLAGRLMQDWYIIDNELEDWSEIGWTIDIGLTDRTGIARV